MIGLERTLAPKTLTGPTVEEAYAEAEAYFADETSSARRARFNFDYWPWPNDEVLVALSRTSLGRCSFCGRSDRPDVDMAPLRFRPAQEAVAADGRISRPHYWWLAYEWQNLYLACAECREAKGTKFPTAARRARVGVRDGLNERELPLLIDPCDDDPEAHFGYLDSGEVAWFDERGLITIETFDLNRPRLLEERRTQIEETKAAINEVAWMLSTARLRDFVDAFLQLYSIEAPFAALQRQFFNQWVQVRPRKIEKALDEITSGRVTLDGVAGSLRRITGRTKTSLSRQLGPVGAESDLDLAGPFESPREERVSAEPAGARLSMPAPEIRSDISAYELGREIQEVEIHNFQGIDSMRLRVPGGSGGGSWLMLLGENGAGKTAALKAIALALMTPDERDRVLPDPSDILKYGKKSGSVLVDLTGNRNAREYQFARRKESHRSTGSQTPLLLAAYGATRLLPGDKEAGPDDRGPHTGSLFDPRFPLSRPADWLHGLSRSDFDAVARGLHSILQLKDNDEIRRDKRFGFTIASPRGRLRPADLSDGYRTMAALALDMMNLFLKTWGQLDVAEGIVLIDEIGSHLHPRWQMKVVGAMRNTFPRAQFIATTHDPLCLRGLKDGEVVVMRKVDNRLFVQQDGLPSVKGLTVDQLLTSEHFGLFSTLEPGMEDMFERYYDLLAAPELDEFEGEELEVLRIALTRSQQLGRTRREQLALEAVDSYLAAEQHASSAERLRELPVEARQRVRRLLENVV
jgi:hypothetical protein